MTVHFAEEHMNVLERAQRIFEDRSHVRGQMWLEFPPSDKVRELVERSRRLEVAMEAYVMEPVQPQNSSIAPILINDALDIINYAAFLVKQIERGMRG